MQLGTGLVARERLQAPSRAQLDEVTRAPAAERQHSRRHVGDLRYALGAARGNMVRQVLAMTIGADLAFIHLNTEAAGGGDQRLAQLKPMMLDGVQTMTAGGGR